MEITVNGERRQAPEEATVAELLELLEVPQERVAVELDRVIVRRPEWPKTKLRAGAHVEIVHFVGGG